MGTQEAFITDSLSGVLELIEPHGVRRRVTAIDLTMLEDRVIAPDAKKPKDNTENSKDKAGNSKDKAATEIKGSLGSLNILPTEIIMMVVCAMEFRSVAAFRNVNTCAREMAESVTKFGAVKKHAPFVLRAAINLNPPLSPASVATLDASLLEKACSCCGMRDGSIISLLDCRRYCRTCFSWNGGHQCIWCYGGTDG